MQMKLLGLEGLFLEEPMTKVNHILTWNITKISSYSPQLVDHLID